MNKITEKWRPTGLPDDVSNIHRYVRNQENLIPFV